MDEDLSKDSVAIPAMKRFFYRRVRVFPSGRSGAKRDPEPCPSPKDISGGNTHQFGTPGSFCFRTCDEIQGWGCSTFDGRTVKVNGTTVTCGQALPPKVGSFYYFDVSAGLYDYSAIYWWGDVHDVPACGHYPSWQSGATVPVCAK